MREGSGQTPVAAGGADGALAGRAAAGEPGALSALLDRWREPLVRYCRRIVRHEHDAHDLAHDTLLRAVRSLDRYDRSRPFAPWVYRIARNVCLNHLDRRRTRVRATERMETPASPPGPDVLTSRREQVARVRAAIASLDPSDRELLEMKLLRGDDNATIAERLGITPGALRVRACRALAKAPRTRRREGSDAMNDRLDSCRSDELELYAFDFLEGAERSAVEEHVATCAECRAELADRLGTRDLVELELRRSARPEMPRVVAPLPVVARPSSNGRAHAPVSAARGRRVLLPILAAAAVLLVCALIVLDVTGPDPVAPERVWTEVGTGIRVNGDQGRVRVRSARRLEIDEGRLLVDVDAGDEPVRVATPNAVVACDEGRFELSTSPGGTSVRVDRGAVRFEQFDSPPRIVAGRDGRIIFVIRDAAILGENERLKEENARLLAEIERLGGTAPTDDEPLKSAEEEIERFDWSELAWALEKIEPMLRRGEMPRDPKTLARYSAMLRTLGRVARALDLEADVDALRRDPRTGSKLLGAIVRREWPEAAPADVAAVEDAARDALEVYEADAETAVTPVEVAAADERLEAKLNESLERVREQYGEPVSELTIREDSSSTNDGTDREPPPSNDTGGGGTTGGESDPVSITPTKPTTTSVLDSSGFATSSDRYRVHTGSAATVARAVLVAWKSDLGLTARENGALEPVARTIAQHWVEASIAKLNQASAATVAGLEASLGLGPKPRDVSASAVNLLRLALLELQQRAERELAPELPAAARKKLESGATRATILLPAR